MARTAPGRDDGWHLRSIQCSSVITGTRLRQYYRTSRAIREGVAKREHSESRNSFRLHTRRGLASWRRGSRSGRVAEHPAKTDRQPSHIRSWMTRAHEAAENFFKHSWRYR
jgi:hypothetical protein